MKRYKSCTSFMMAFAFLLATGAWAGDQPATSDGTPAILASLDSGKITILDDQDSLEVRGQAYKYVLVRTVLNAFDFAPWLNWTLNPFGYRYGAWGGPNWTNGGLPDYLYAHPADHMDWLFKKHDKGLLTDQGLIDALEDLPNVSVGFWGLIYFPFKAAKNIRKTGLPLYDNVWVSSLSVLGGRPFLGWRPMPFTEYSRRQAILGMQLYGLLP